MRASRKFGRRVGTRRDIHLMRGFPASVGTYSPVMRGRRKDAFLRVGRFIRTKVPKESLEEGSAVESESDTKCWQGVGRTASRRKPRGRSKPAKQGRYVWD